MQTHGFNWQILVGFLLSVFAMLSYPLIFAAWPVTRDFPWVNLLLFVIAAILLIVGIRRGFGAGRGKTSKIGAIIFPVLSVASFGLFILVAFISAKWLPESKVAPQVSQKVSDFTLSDSSGAKIDLAELLKEPIAGGSQTIAPKGVLLIFYRGYW